MKNNIEDFAKDLRELSTKHNLILQFDATPIQGKYDTLFKISVLEMSVEDLIKVTRILGENLK